MQSIAEERSNSSATAWAEHGSTATSIRHAVAHAAHLLPSQGPITVFVYHNTLHAYEHFRFDEGGKAGSKTFGCNAYLPKDRYRGYLGQGRIRQEDLSEVLIDDVGETADLLMGPLGTRHRLRLGMLQFPLQTGPDSELRWLMADSDTRRRFRHEVKGDRRKQFIVQTRRWVMQELEHECSEKNCNRLHST